MNQNVEVMYVSFNKKPNLEKIWLFIIAIPERGRQRDQTEGRSFCIPMFFEIKIL